MANAQVMFQVFGVGGVTVKPPLSFIEMERLIEVVKGHPREPRPEFYRILGRMIEQLPRYMASGRDKPGPVKPGSRQDFSTAIWYRVLAHPASGDQLCQSIRRLMREQPQQSIRVSWWLKDLKHPDFVMLGHEFCFVPPDFNQTAPPLVLH